jgi:hypothetical protein
MQKQVWIKIQGDEYQGSFPASFAKSLCEMQRGFYRVAALALHNDENVKRLTRDELERFEIVFVVATGSTEISTDAIEKFESIVSEAFKNMPSEYQMLLIGFFIICYFGYQAYERHCEQSETKILSQERAEQIKALQEITNKGYVAVENVAALLAQNTDNLLMSVMSNAPTATQIELAGITYTAADIAEANKRAYANRTSEIINGEYQIIVIDSSKPELLKLTLRDIYNIEYIVKLDTTDRFAEDVEKVWEVAKSGKLVPIQLTAVFKNRQYEKGFIKTIDLN